MTIAITNVTILPNGVAQCHADTEPSNWQALIYPENCSDPETHFPYPYDPCRGQCYENFGIYDFVAMMNEPITVVTYGYIYPLLVIITVLSNFFVVIVLAQRHMTTPTNVVLMYMAIADLAVALVPFPFILFYHILGNYQRLENMQSWWCYLALYMTDALPPFCHNISIWLTVLLAVQRFIYIQYPMSAQRWCTAAKVRIFTLVIITAAALCAVQRFMDILQYDIIKFKVLKTGYPNVTVGEYYRCMYRYSAVVKTIGEDAYFSFYYWTRVIVFVVVPSILLVVFSALLIRGITKAARRRQRLMVTEARSQSESNKTNIMLVIIVAIFLAVNLPQGLILAIFVFSRLNPGLFRVLNPKAMLFATVVANMLILVTYPINFAIYCSMSAQFRETFKRLFQRGLENPLIPSRSHSQYSQLILLQTNGKMSNNGYNSGKSSKLSNLLSVPTPRTHNKASATDNSFELSSPSRSNCSTPAAVGHFSSVTTHL